MAEFIFANEKFRNLVEKLIDADSFNLGHIDPDTIVYLYKEEKNPKRPLRISQIQQPYVLLTNKFYIIEISEELVDKISKEHLEIYMYRILRQIDCESGRVIAPDVMEWKDVLNMYGFEWQKQSNVKSIFQVLENRRNQELQTDNEGNVIQMYS